MTALSEPDDLGLCTGGLPLQQRDGHCIRCGATERDRCALAASEATATPKTETSEKEG